MHEATGESRNGRRNTWGLYMKKKKKTKKAATDHRGVMDARGRVTIPLEVRRHLNLKPEQKLSLSLPKALSTPDCSAWVQKLIRFKNMWGLLDLFRAESKESMLGCGHAR